MAKRRFNWTLAIVIVIAVGVLAVTAVSLRKWQRGRMAYSSLDTGLKAYESKDWQTAVRELGKYVALEQSDIDVLGKYAQAHLKMRPLKRGNIQQAISTYRIILRVDGEHEESVEALVNLYLEMNVATEAELIASRYLEGNESPTVSRLLASSFIRQRKFKEAADGLRSLLEKYPNELAAYELMGLLAERYPEDTGSTAEDWFEDAVAKNPENALSYILRSSYRFRNGDPDGSAADMTKATQLDLSESKVHSRLIAELVKQEDFDLAGKHLDILAEQDPSNEAVWFLWAALGLETKSQETMLKAASEGLKNLVDQPWDFMPIAAELYIRCSEFDLAAECIARLKEKEIAPAAVTYIEGLLAVESSDDYKAIELWRKAISLGDDSVRLKLLLASAYSRIGDKQSAIMQLRNLIMESPDTYKAHVEIARLLSGQGQSAEAYSFAKKARQLSPNNLGANLLEVQAHMRVLEATEGSEDSPEWLDIEKMLTRLDEATDGRSEVKLLKFQYAMSREQYDDAEDILGELNEQDRSKLEAQLAEVRLLLVRNNMSKAISKLEAIIEEFQQELQPARFLAAVYSTNGLTDECQQVLDGALARFESKGSRRQVGLMLAEFYRKQNDREKSVQTLQSLSQELKDDIVVKRELLKYKQATQDDSLGQNIIEDIKAVEGEDGWQWRYEQARIWFNSDDFVSQAPHAITLLNENLRANQGDRLSRMLLAATYEKTGKLQLAINEYQEALNRWPEDIQIVVNYVAVLYKVKEYDQADSVLNRAATRKLANPQLSKLELRSLLRQGKLNSAETVLEELAGKDPDDQNILLSLALLKIRLDDFEEAEKLLAKLSKNQPDSISVAAAQVELKLRKKLDKEALQICDEIVGELENASAYILRGRTYVSLGKHDMAKEDFDRATVIDPDNYYAWVYKSEFYRMAGQFGQTMEDMERAIALAPDNLQIKKRAIAIYLLSSNPEKRDKGIAILDQALAIDPDDAELRLYKAQTLAMKGTAPARREAIKMLSASSRDQPGNPSSWAMLAELYLLRDDQGSAMDAVLNGLSYSPKDRILLLLKGKVEAMRSPMLAVPTLKGLLEIYPDDEEIAFQLSEAYLKGKEYEKAIDILQDMLASSDEKSSKKINIALARALYKSGRKDEASSKFADLEGKAANDNEVFLAEARILAEDKQWEKIVSKVKTRYEAGDTKNAQVTTIANSLTVSGEMQGYQAAEILLKMVLAADSSDNPEVMNSLAMLLQIMDRPDEAADLYRKILAIIPNAPMVVNNLAWLMCEEQAQYQEALAMTDAVLLKFPEYIDLIDTRGMIYYRMQQYDEAISDFNKCVELYPKNNPGLAATYFHLGRAQAATGSRTAAITNLKLAIEINESKSTLSKEQLDEMRKLMDGLAG